MEGVGRSQRSGQERGAVMEAEAGEKSNMQPSEEQPPLAENGE